MKTFHNIVSIVLQPLLIPTYGIIMLVNMEVFDLLPAAWHWVAIVGTFLFTAVFPMIPIFRMIRKGEIKDLFIANRQERTLPYLFSIMAYAFWVAFLWNTLQLPLFIVGMGAGATLSIVFALIINLKWKISAHTSSMGGLTAAFIGVCYRMSMNPVWLVTLLFIASALVAISRLELKAHTPAQVLCGFILGFMLVLVPAFIL